jgi:sporulation protein YlmC with PRC-barrel domain
MAMPGNTQTMAMMGKVTRIKRKSFVNSDGDLQGMVGNVILQLSGSASQEVKIEYIKALDFKALKSY